MSDGRLRGRWGRVGRILILTSLLGAATPALTQGQALTACGQVDPWAAGLAERSLTYGAMGRFATTWQGAPVSCAGGPDAEFDGRSFGTVTVSFENGLVFAVRTFPPEGSVTRMTLPGGFDDPELVVAVARDHAEGFGLRVDWSDPELTREDGRTVETYWDPEPGLNASVSFVRDGPRLVEVRISAAP